MFFDMINLSEALDPNTINSDEHLDLRTARLLKDIANDVLPEIQMEEDYPNKNDDNKMPILDMKVWQDDKEGFILYQHYQKPMASKSVMHAQSAQSDSCKKSVHTQEIMRRLLNSSSRLDWNTDVAPVISVYMSRMMQAGYPETYRENVLKRALRIYDKMVKDDQKGLRPIYRPKDWNIVSRRREQVKKRNSWSTKGGHVSPIFVPPTPNGELAKELRTIAENETEAGVSFKIVETGGDSVKSRIQKSNPTATKGCTNPECVACKTERGGGGNCRKGGITYQFECQLCPPSQKNLYIGESSRNLFTRGKEHMDMFRNKDKKSFMMKHQTEKHQGVAGNFTAKVTGGAQDCLTRQVREAVLIRRCQVPVMNSKTEWHQPALFRVQNEILRG